MKPDKIYLSLFLLLIVTSVSWISSCTHDTDITGLPEVCFQRDVLPIFQNSCAMNGCHSGGSEFSLTSYDQIVRNETQLTQKFPALRIVEDAGVKTGNHSFPEGFETVNTRRIFLEGHGFELAELSWFASKNFSAVKSFSLFFISGSA